MAAPSHELTYYKETNSYAAPNQKIEFISPIYVGSGKKKKKVGKKTQTVYTGPAGEILSQGPTITQAAGVTFLSPVRNEAGQTSTDVLIQKNRAKSTITQITEEATGRTYKGRVETRGRRQVFVGFYKPTAEEKKATEIKINARKAGFFSFQESSADIAKQTKNQKLASNIALKMALPISTYKIPENADITFKATTAPAPAKKETFLTKAIDFSNTPILSSLKKSKNEKIALFASVAEYDINSAFNKILHGGRIGSSNYQFTRNPTQKFIISTAGETITDLTKPAYLITAYGANVFFKGAAAGAGALFPKLTGKIGPTLAKRAGIGLLTTYGTFQALDVATGKKTASQATGEALASVIAFKLTEKPAQATVNLIGSTTKAAYFGMRTSYRRNVLLSDKAILKDYTDKSIFARSPNLQYKGQTNLFNKPADLSLNELKNPSNPLLTRQGYLKFGGQYATDAAGRRLEVSSLIDNSLIKDTGQTKLIADKLLYGKRLDIVKLEGGGVLLNKIDIVPKFTDTAKYTFLNPISVKDIGVYGPALKQTNLIKFGFSEISFKAKPQPLGFKNIDVFFRDIVISKRIDGLNVFNKPPVFKITPGRVSSPVTPGVSSPASGVNVGGRALSITSTKSGAADLYFKAAGTNKNIYVSYPEYTAGPTKTPITEIGKKSGLFGGIPYFNIKGGINERNNIKAEFKTNFKGYEGPKIDNKSFSSFSPDIRADTIIKVGQGDIIDTGRKTSQRQSSRLITEQIQIPAQALGSSQAKAVAFPVTPSLGFKNITFNYKLPPLIKIELPKFNFGFGNQKGGFNLFKIGRPTAFKVGVREAFFNIKGSTPKGSIITGLGGRFVPLKFKLGGF